MPRARAANPERKPKAKSVRKPRRAPLKRAAEPLRVLEAEMETKAEAEARESSVAAFDIPVRPTLAHGHAVHSHHRDTLNHPNLRKQRLTMILSICVIMAVILIAWALNLRRLIRDGLEASPKKESQQLDFANLKKELSETMAEVQTNLDQLSQITSTVTPTAEPETSPITSTAPPAISPAAAPQDGLPAEPITPPAQPTLPN